MKNITQSFPDILHKLWSEWELRVMVLLSLCLQIVLVILGRRRKYIVGTRFGFVIDFVVWTAYLSADQVATISLGIISHSISNNSSNKSHPPDPNSTSAIFITAFWALVFLLHLGGQDNITAYSLDDNNGYLRKLLVFSIQVAVTFMIIFRTWSSTLLGFPIILIFVSGILKNGERIWTLWSSSSNHLRNSLLPPPNAGPDYSESIKKYNEGKNTGVEMKFYLKKEENSSSLVQAAANYETTDGTQEAQPLLEAPIEMRTKEEVEFLTEAYSLFNIFQRLYADLFITYHERRRGISILEKYKSPQQVFKVIEVELGIMYDVLYTKASIAHSKIGLCLRSISILFSALALWLFWKAIDSSEHDFSGIDVVITSLLLSVAVLIDICSGIMLIFSGPSFLWLSKRNINIGASMYRAISSPPLALIIGKSWSGNMGQYNLIDICLRNKTANRCEKILELFEINAKLKMSWEEVTDALKEQIMTRIVNKLNTGIVYNDPMQSLEAAISSVFLDNNFPLHITSRFDSSFMEEFDFNVLLWHIATDICYYSNNPDPPSMCKVSKSLSDYLMYLLVMCPCLLPAGIGEIRYKDTCAEATRYLEQRMNVIQRSKSQACSLLLGEDTEPPPYVVKGDKSKSVLFDGVILAQKLQKLGNENKWVVITQVWIEMLWYAALRSEWKYHGQQLSKGGEFLTHVRLLLAHLGFTRQYKVLHGEVELVYSH